MIIQRDQYGRRNHNDTSSQAGCFTYTANNQLFFGLDRKKDVMALDLGEGGNWNSSRGSVQMYIH